MKDFKVQCYVDANTYNIMDKEFRNPTAANAALLDSVKLDSLNCISTQTIKEMSKSAQQNLENGKYTFIMEFDLETTGDISCDKKLGINKGKKNKGRK